MSCRPLIRVDRLDDPRIAAYRNLKDRELARDGGRFIAEGELVVRRLLESCYPIESVLLAETTVSRLAALVPAEVPVYVGSAELVNRIVGFRFHSGVIAVGRRIPGPSLERLAASWGQGPSTLLVLPETNQTDNLGSMIRIAAAFGVDGVILGPRCCDPFYRQSVRVSVGTVFRTVIVRSEDLLRDLRLLQQQWRVELIATVLHDQAEPLACAVRRQRTAILFGNEAQGLAPEQLAICDRRVTIPMQPGVDSLNVAVAAGIVLYHFTRCAPMAG